MSSLVKVTVHLPSQRYRSVQILLYKNFTKIRRLNAFFFFVPFKAIQSYVTTPPPQLLCCRGMDLEEGARLQDS